jgi:tetratricopeptide (TPR) repeat protein/cellulose biosynthesis protein BcsQ
VNNKTPSGKIISFYSYKGGTGRSMAVANIAWILASNRKRVLVIDWDLEAPGLHRYFRPFLVDKDLESTEGLIDFVTQFAFEMMSPLKEGERLPDDWYFEHADILRFAVSLEWQFPEGGAIDFVPSGRQGPSYSTRFSSFDWQNFYERLGGGVFIETVKKRMRAEYDYILVDSRTGVSDTAGICTVQMPDVLVVCFTLNNQSSSGAAHIAKSVHSQRQDDIATGKLKIFPVPMRVDPFEKGKLDRRRKYAQRLFNPLFGDSLFFDQATYWPAVEVPYVPHLAYEEVLTPFVENPNDPKSALAAIGRITGYITGGEISDFYFPISPIDQQQVLLAFSELPQDASSPNRQETALDIEDSILTVEAEFTRLAQDEQEWFRNLWSRLLNLRNSGPDFIYETVPTALNDFSEAEQTIVRELLKTGLLKSDRDALTGKVFVAVSNEDFVRRWSRLQNWIKADADFLLWRQKLQEIIRVWQLSQRHVDFLLRRISLTEAARWLKHHEDRLNTFETSYLHESQSVDRKAELRFWWTIGTVAFVFAMMLVVSIVFLARLNKSYDQTLQKNTQAIASNYKGLQAESSGHPQDAVKYFEESVAYNPDNVEGLNNLGNAYMKVGKYKDAVRPFEYALELEKTSIQAYLNVSRAYDAMGNYEKALESFSTLYTRVNLIPGLAENLAPVADKVAYERALIYEHNKDYGMALKYFTDAIVANQNYGEAFLERGKIYALLGDKKAAQRDFQFIRAISKDPTLLSAVSAEENRLNGQTP